MQKKEQEPKIIATIDTRKLTSAVTPPNQFSSQIARIAEEAIKVSRVNMPLIQKGLRGFLMHDTNFIDSIIAARENALKSIAEVAKSGVFNEIQKTAELASSFIRRVQSHFPENWPPDEVEQCANLSMLGIPLIFVPRSDIVAKITKTTTITGAKQALVRNDMIIISDCEKAIAESAWLSRDMRQHIHESIKCYKAGIYRASQSTANVAFDSLLNEVIDIQKWRRSNSKPKQLSAAKVRGLTNEFTNDLMDLPLSRAPFYTLLMFPVIGSALADFEIGNRATHVNDYNRHMSAHTVSSKQYKKSNALLVIMAVASICKITQLRGKNWMQITAEEYGVTLKKPL